MKPFWISDFRCAIAANFVAVGIAICFGGCIGSPMNRAATQPVTVTDPATTQPGYWLEKPAVGSVMYDSFATLFKTCENVSRDFGFKIDRVDYRLGVLTTEPLESAQVWEPWRPDVQTFDDAKEATVASMRRTIRYDFTRNDDGTFQVAPKVLVERQTVQERRITNVALYRGAYQREKPGDRPQGSRETDQGFMIPSRYWYAVGRDTVLEAKLAREVSARLAAKAKREPTTQPE